jgi:hypothetical protein
MRQYTNGLRALLRKRQPGVTMDGLFHYKASYEDLA